MKKIYFHNSFLIEENININTSPQKQHVIQKKISKQKQVVDINKLLNRVKIHKKNEVKKKIIFFNKSKSLTN